MPSSTRHLAGIQFVDIPPDLPEKLPRMDIALFIGFASAGPLHTPVVVEDSSHYAAVFGDDLPLATDRVTGQVDYAYLGPAVRAFFTNGGRRCWVVRVAGIPADNGADRPDSAPETNRFPIAGLAKITSEGLQPAFAQARSAGSYFDRFRSASSLLSLAVPVLSWSPHGVEIPAGAQAGVQAGDLLRLNFSADDSAVYLVISSIAGLADSPPRSRPSRYALNTTPLGYTRRIPVEELLGSSPFSAAWTRLPDQPEIVSVAEVVVPDDLSPPSSDTPIRLSVSPSFQPPPGSLLHLQAGAERFYFVVDQAEPATDLGSPPSENASLRGRAYVFEASLPSLLSSDSPSGEILTFELTSERALADRARLSDLGFSPQHPRYWNALPSDSEDFGNSDSASTPDRVQAALIQESTSPRFPLAGDGDFAAFFIPLGMNALPEPSMAAVNSGRVALVREGLETFSSALFLDPRLQGSFTSTLLADADFLQYQATGALPLRGLHATLTAEEPTIVAIPDATHRRWHRESPEPPVPPKPSAGLPHPHWWHFLPCNPPATPPADTYAPEVGYFLNCSLRVLAIPQLRSDGPDTSGAYRLSWSSPDADVSFVLEEATQPDFGDAVDPFTTSAREHTYLARDPGVYYYRVRAVADGETSDWSDGVVVQIGATDRWSLETAAAYEPDILLDVHRALLRTCGARADTVGVLSIAGHWREADALSYVATLKRADDVTATIPPLSAGERQVLSYGAMYHPWQYVNSQNADIVLRPPDGVIAGALARRALSRGAWIAPANDPLAGVLGLEPRIDSARHLDLLLAQLNVIRQEARGFLVLSSDTLSDDPELRPLSIRRLLILLRRAALRLGNTYVFEPNDLALRRVVKGAFDSLLQQLFMRGAFAGGTSSDSYQVVVDDSINTPEAMDQGQFFVDLKVAPALPMSFLTIRLVQSGEQLTAVEVL